MCGGSQLGLAGPRHSPHDGQRVLRSDLQMKCAQKEGYRSFQPSQLDTARKEGQISPLTDFKYRTREHAHLPQLSECLCLRDGLSGSSSATESSHGLGVRAGAKG